MKNIVIGIGICSWLLIAYLMCRCSYLEDKYETAEANVVSLNTTIQDEAVAYQTSYSAWKSANDSLSRELEKYVGKNTKEIVRIKEKVKLTDTLLIPFSDTVVKVKDIRLDTTLVNDWRTIHIRIEPDSTSFRLSDDITVPCWLTYSVNKEKRLTRAYSTWFGRQIWGPLFSSVKVDVVKVHSQNPFIRIDSTQFIQIID